ncbi:hypothetical protein IQ238_02930 [Pleurocapsales cyanobacterium LEGE 06147]|nr:hypothetical protein [Pleurocapsales cyanobacterium LEGE 06147]
MKQVKSFINKNWLLLLILFLLGGRIIISFLGFLFNNLEREVEFSEVNNNCEEVKKQAIDARTKYEQKLNKENQKNASIFTFLKPHDSTEWENLKMTEKNFETWCLKLTPGSKVIGTNLNAEIQEIAPANPVITYQPKVGDKVKLNRFNKEGEYIVAQIIGNNIWVKDENSSDFKENVELYEIEPIMRKRHPVISRQIFTLLKNQKKIGFD